MFGVERRNRIMDILNENKSLTVQSAASLFEVAEETIRRDLKVLERHNLLKRTHGGAILSEEIADEDPLKVREGINISGKNAIGRKAAELVKNGDTIFLDASTSSLYVAKHLKDKRGLTVITNAVRVILELVECYDITLISTGGVIRNKSLSYVGRIAENAVDSYQADLVFFSCKGFSPDRGLTDSNEQESDIRKRMLNRSKKAVFLCDETKFDKVGFATTANLTDIDYLITDKELTEGWKKEILNSGVELKV